MNAWNAEKLERQRKPALAREAFESRQNAVANDPADVQRSDPAPILEVQAAKTTSGDDGLLKKHSSFRLRKILVPVDFSEPSENALAYATGFAQEFGARLVLMHVISPITYSTPGPMPPPIRELEQDLQRDATQKLVQLKGAAAGADDEKVPPPETYVCTGLADVEINRAAREMAADLIIMATHGLTGLKHLFLGSTTAHLVGHAPCPVLVVHEHDQEPVR